MRSRQSRIKNYFAENRLFTVRSIVAGVIAAVLLVTVAGRLFYLQVLKYDYYHNLSQGNSIRTEPIPPSRGLILDRHGVVLADNLPAFNVELVREQVGDNKALDVTLAQLVDIGLLRSEEVGNIRRTILLHKVYESVPVKLLLNEDISPETLRETDQRKLIPPLAGALLKNEQDMHLFERIAFMSRRKGE